MATVIDILNEKGGGGKTTTATTMAYMLAQQGHRVLLDFDRQGHSSIICGVSNPNKLEVLTATLMNCGRNMTKRVPTIQLESLDDMLDFPKKGRSGFHRAPSRRRGERAADYRLADYRVGGLSRPSCGIPMMAIHHQQRPQ